MGEVSQLTHESPQAVEDWQEIDEGGAVRTLELDSEQGRQIADLVYTTSRRYGSVENPRLLHDATVLAHQLPLGLQHFVNDFRMSLPAWGACRISGLPVDELTVGPTPAHWQPKVQTTHREEILGLLVASLLGDLFCWKAEQDGHLIHDIVPIRQHDGQQMSTSSGEEIWWHTEEAYHPYSADYLGLLCLRSPDPVPTTYATVDSVELSEDQIRVLCEPRFKIRPVASHLTAGGDAELRAQQRAPVLFGSPVAPFIRIDPYFMDRSDEDAEAKAALDALIAGIDKNLREVALGPGDLCFIDNLKAVHGRRPIHARFDGTDRWLKRINVTRDLRKSRDASNGPGDRALV